MPWWNQWAQEKREAVWNRAEVSARGLACGLSWGGDLGSPSRWRGGARGQGPVASVGMVSKPWDVFLSTFKGLCGQQFSASP